MVAEVKMPSISEYQNEINGTRRVSLLPDYYLPRPSINALVLQGNRLLIVVSGYGDIVQQEIGISTPILWGFMSTHLRLYDTSLLSVTGNLTLIGTTDVHGNFAELRVTNGIAHVLTISSINTYDPLVSQVGRWNFNESLSDEEYQQQVAELVNQTALPALFAQRLVSELEMQGNAPNLVKICLWQNMPSGSSLEKLTFSDGVINTLAQIHSLDMTSGLSHLQISSAGSFMPGYWARFYGAPETLIIAGEGWTFDLQKQISLQATYFIGFRIDGVASVPHSVGSVDGHVSDLCSMLPGKVIGISQLQSALCFSSSTTMQLMLSLIHFASQPLSVRDGSSLPSLSMLQPQNPTARHLEAPPMKQSHSPQRRTILPFFACQGRTVLSLVSWRKLDE